MTVPRSHHEVALRDFLEQVVAIARSAGEIALRHQGALGQLAVESKGLLDYVTRADREVEALIVGEIKSLYPADGVLGEEGASQAGTTGRLWIIDPIDGTHNFIRGMPHWGISIGVLQDGRPLAGVIYLPALGTLLSAAAGAGAWCNGAALEVPRRTGDLIAFTSAGPGVSTESHRWLTTVVREELRGSERRLGSATAALAAVAQGQGDVYIALDDHIWDVCAASVILEESGRAHSLQWEAPVGASPMVYIAGSISTVDSVRYAFQRSTLTPGLAACVAPGHSSIHNETAVQRHAGFESKQ